MPVFDRDIRKTLLRQLRDEHAQDHETLIVEELGVCEGNARVDIAVLNGNISGFEIKSERDSLARLESQVQSYGRCFDSLTLVAPARHLNHARAILPQWWGLTEVTVERAREWDLKPWRQPKKNNGVEAGAVVGLLWRTEVFSILAAHGLDEGIRTKPMKYAKERIVKNLSVPVIREEVRCALKARGDWRSAPTPFRCGDSSQSCATSRHSQGNRNWLLSLESQHPQS
jgi:hypothetical protein